MSSTKVFYVEIGPLIFEKFYSGIPNVTLRLVEQLMRTGLDLVFFHSTGIYDFGVVQEAIKSRSNGAFLNEPNRGMIGTLEIDRRIPDSVGIFTNSRHGLPRLFEIECQIVYDLTPLVTPQFCQPETIEFHFDQYMKEFQVCDFIACISEATRQDLLHYFPEIRPSSVFVSHLAADEPSAKDVEKYEELAAHVEVEPYFLVMGTIEPRKNLGLLFALFRAYPEYLESHRWVICGRDGWLIKFEQLAGQLSNLPEHLQQRVRRFDYVSNFEKYALLKQARALIFPSFYEGFGLPVIEAMWLGTPVLASTSSSIPEAGGEAAIYFDPESVSSLKRAIDHLESLSARRRLSLVNRGLVHAQSFSWASFANNILQGIGVRV